MLQGFIGLVVGLVVGALAQWYRVTQQYQRELGNAEARAAHAEQLLRHERERFQQSVNQRTREVRAEASRRLVKRLLGDDWDY